MSFEEILRRSSCLLSLSGYSDASRRSHKHGVSVQRSNQINDTFVSYCANTGFSVAVGMLDTEGKFLKHPFLCCSFLWNINTSLCPWYFRTSYFSLAWAHFEVYFWSFNFTCTTYRLLHDCKLCGFLGVKWRLLIYFVECTICIFVLLYSIYYTVLQRRFCWPQFFSDIERLGDWWPEPSAVTILALTVKVLSAEDTNWPTSRWHYITHPTHQFT